MDDSAICLPWDKKFWLGQRAVYGGIQGVTKFTREYGGILVSYYPLGQTLQKHGVPLLDSTMEPFVLPKQLLLLTVGKV